MRVQEVKPLQITCCTYKTLNNMHTVPKPCWLVSQHYVGFSNHSTYNHRTHVAQYQGRRIQEGKGKQKWEQRSEKSQGEVKQGERGGSFQCGWEERREGSMPRFKLPVNAKADCEKPLPDSSFNAFGEYRRTHATISGRMRSQSKLIRPLAGRPHFHAPRH